MRKLLFQFDSSRLPSAFDRVVAYDGGADEVLSYGGVVEADVRDLVHGAIFTRGLKDLRKTAIFIGGADMAAGERLLAEARKAFFGPFSVSVMLDSNGSNTTAVAAVAKAMQTVGDVSGRRAVVTAGTGPVGQRAAGLLARAGADVVITSRRHDEGEHIAQAVSARFHGRVTSVEVRDPSALAPVLDGAHILINAGPAGVKIVPRDAWASRPGLQVAIDLNAVPPLGVEGVEVNDNGVVREGVTVFGALGVGGFKMKVHKACIARLFERNDLVLDAESIADVANALIPATT
jgi:methylenetetrahydrofolate/methylenetetrahydromethanopterin dehydrogenase (NADP+)